VLFNGKLKPEFDTDGQLRVVADEEIEDSDDDDFDERYREDDAEKD